VPATLETVIAPCPALQYAGWCHGIGTLWSVWDESAAAITAGVCPLVVHDGHLDPSGPADALHHTIREHRERGNHRRQPSQWAPFLHIGPWHPAPFTFQREIQRRCTWFG
jgi:CHAT domain-containing protein